MRPQLRLIGLARGGGRGITTGRNRRETCLTKWPRGLDKRSDVSARSHRSAQFANYDASDRLSLAARYFFAQHASPCVRSPSSVIYASGSGKMYSCQQIRARSNIFSFRGKSLLTTASLPTYGCRTRIPFFFFSNRLLTFILVARLASRVSKVQLINTIVIMNWSNIHIFVKLTDVSIKRYLAMEFMMFRRNWR